LIVLLAPNQAPKVLVQWSKDREKSSATTIHKFEFLTHKTTCASEMLEKTTCRKICQKRPPTSGGTSGQATRGTCRLGRRWHGGAATANAGTSAAIDGHAPRHPAATAKGGMACATTSCRHCQRRHASCRHCQRRHGPPPSRMRHSSCRHCQRRQGPPPSLPVYVPDLGMAAPPCRRWPRRHVPRV
jgi:hypothetical protein